MDNDAAKELGEFRRLIMKATLEQLAPLITTTMDGMIDALRSMAPEAYDAIETAAALCAELHKRLAIDKPPVAWAPVVGNA